MALDRARVAAGTGILAVAAALRDFRERAPAIGERILRPKRLQRFADGATRTSQWLSALFIGPVVVVSFAFIRVFNNLMTEIFQAQIPPDQQVGLIAWMITALTLFAFIIAAWGWFQFVRTAGFGWFSYD